MFWKNNIYKERKQELSYENIHFSSTVVFLQKNVGWWLRGGFQGPYKSPIGLLQGNLLLSRLDRYKFPFPCSPNAHHFSSPPAPYHSLSASSQATGPGWNYQASRDTHCSKETMFKEWKGTFCSDMVKRHLFLKMFLLADKFHNTFLACFIDVSIILLLLLLLLPIMCY